jgi:hypothetical protein
LRAAVVAAELATLWITWPLWTVRATPPLLPAIDLPQWDVGPWIAGSALFALVVPRWGLLVHAALIAWAMLLDQTRIQPQMISFVCLLAGAQRWRVGPAIARAHLLSLWFWAAWHKLISVGWYDDTIPWLLKLPDDTPGTTKIVLGAGLALMEMSLAVLALFPRTRRLAVVMALFFHTGLLLTLASHQWNYAIWPWNVAVMAAAVLLILPWAEGPRQSLTAQAGWGQAAVLAILLFPALYYVGWCDPYPAHCLYSSNVPSATIVHADGTAEDINYLAGCEVPLPPTHRHFDAYFARTARPGDVMIVTDPRRWAKLSGMSQRVVEPP